MIVPSYHYMIGPAAALVAFGLIVLICRWVFSTAPRDARAARARTAGDFGLLVPVAAARTVEEAEGLRQRLRAAGIRCTATTGEGGWQVLVFRDDAARAGELVRR